MKTIILSILFLFDLSIMQVYADCFTGFACSIDELSKIEQQQNIENAKFILNYFNKNNDFSLKGTQPSGYRDLFIYHNIII